jgi:OOP family OmpA-OmpF porin
MRNLGILLLAAGCATVAREQASDVARLLDEARTSGAKRCAPRELAVAEANAAFAEVDLQQGEGVRADAHLVVAMRAVREALVKSAPCAPVVDPPAPVDSDGDSLTDDVDRCPQAAEDTDGFEDADGCPDPDDDADGVPDASDACAREPGPSTNRGCPRRDTDRDGLTDDVDRCPQAAEDKDGFEDADGCPEPDNDGDELPDTLDACPNEAGVPEARGCPPGDRDADGFPDHLDRCPAEAGVPEEQGCPAKAQLVVLKRERIEVAEQVHFDLNRWRILPESFPLLAQVAQVLRDHPSLRVRVEGHTDDRAADALNATLSRQRADAVRDHLVQSGIDAGRLEAAGFGETRPVASNDTEEGRGKNRRVEFVVVSP